MIAQTKNAPIHACKGEEFKRLVGIGWMKVYQKVKSPTMSPLWTDIYSLIPQLYLPLLA